MPNVLTRTIAAVVGLGLTLGVAAGPAGAQSDYPRRPITLTIATVIVAAQGTLLVAAGLYLIGNGIFGNPTHGRSSLRLTIRAVNALRR